MLKFCLCFYIFSKKTRFPPPKSEVKNAFFYPISAHSAPLSFSSAFLFKRARTLCSIGVL